MLFFIYSNIFKFKNIIFIIIILFIILNNNSYYHYKLIITLTSWKGRINFIHKNLEKILYNKIKPKKLILNLSREEFPKKNLELPIEILNLLERYNNFEIFWIDKNNNVLKKLIPTLNRFKRDIIITVDDDILYPNDIFENMLKCYKFNSMIEFLKIPSQNIINMDETVFSYNMPNNVTILKIDSKTISIKTKKQENIRVSAIIFISGY